MDIGNLNKYHRCPICDSNMHVKTYYGEWYIEEEYITCPVCKYQQEFSYGNSKISKTVCGEYFEFCWSYLDDINWINKNIEQLNDKIKGRN